MTRRPELRALTSVRGLAAWLVVLFHIRGSIIGLPPLAVSILSKGYLAVDFFFLLSGFVIWLSWGEKLRDGGLAAIPGFLHKRIARIWPLHAFILACTVALALLLLATGRHDSVEYPFHLLPLHVLLMQNWGFTETLAWNGPSWSISTEMAAYLLFPMLVMTIDLRRLHAITLGAMIVGLAMILNAVCAHAGNTTLNYDIVRFGLVRCLIEFGAGTSCCALWLRLRARPIAPALVLTAIAAAIAYLWASGLPEALAVPLLFASILLLLALTSQLRGNPLNTTVLHYFGEISYATYLSHLVLFVTFKLALVTNPTAIPTPLVALYLSIVLLASVVLYHFVERPAQAYINGLTLRIPGMRKARPLAR